MRVITFITDFGSREPFVGIMKGVIYTINPNVKIVDITHEVHPHNLQEACFVLLTSYHYFPQDTIHTIIVDPGVGGERRAVACKSEKFYFVAPDNGVLTPVKKKIVEAVVLENSEYFLKPVSYTFHGRDIFSPVAAHISLGRKLEEFGRSISPQELVEIPFPQAFFGKREVKGEVLYVDRFGNLITNIPVEEFFEWKGSNQIKALLRNKEINRIAKSYKEGGVEPFLIPGSSGFLEVSIYGKSAYQHFEARVGDGIIIKKL
ncbi:SAM-dependent chlorinase/fluorinase [Candidatus Calescamantes bacterium]|nr:SAM-dependent chlorinase/fluorinase [Candidatus Calescamantes bacterium]